MRSLACTAIMWFVLTGSGMGQDVATEGDVLPVPLPNLEPIVDTYVPIVSSDPDEYYQQLRADVIPYIRALKKEGVIRWYAFLPHGADQIGPRVPADSGESYIHLFLEPGIGLEFEAFAPQLPEHFSNPESRPLGSFAGIDGEAIQDNDWAYGWKGIGEASEFVLRLIENHGDNPIPQSNILQFLHFITNPLHLGTKFMFLPEDPIRF